MTAEFAAGLPVLALLLAAVLAAGSAGVAKLRCIDAARSAARLAARHEPVAVALAAAHSAGPAGAEVQVSSAGDLVRVRVTVRLRLPLPGRPAIELGADSVARLEPIVAAVAAAEIAAADADADADADAAGSREPGRQAT